MNLLLLGVSHRTAPVELREKLDFSSRGIGAAAQDLATRTSVPECVVLSTCNRSEIYVASTEPVRQTR
jgi:glutamyl-tRNA reductase